jgi:hypothetical protein
MFLLGGTISKTKTEGSHMLSRKYNVTEMELHEMLIMGAKVRIQIVQLVELCVEGNNAVVQPHKMPRLSKKPKFTLGHHPEAGIESLCFRNGAA